MQATGRFVEQKEDGKVRIEPRRGAELERRRARRHRVARTENASQSVKLLELNLHR